MSEKVCSFNQDLLYCIVFYSCFFLLFVMHVDLRKKECPPFEGYADPRGELEQCYYGQRSAPVMEMNRGGMMNAGGSGKEKEEEKVKVAGGPAIPVVQPNVTAMVNLSEVKEDVNES